MLIRRQVLALLLAWYAWGASAAAAQVFQGGWGIYSQGSTTSGQAGPLMQCAVSVSSPSYTTATTNPASCTTAGAIRVDGSAVTQPVSGSVTVTQPTGTNLHVVVDSAPTTAVTGTFWPETQPISAVSLPLPTGAATSALQGAGLPASLGAGGGLKVDGSGVALPVSGSLTVTQATGTNLHVVVDSAPTTAVTGTFWPETQPISAVSLPLPTGAATSALQGGGLPAALGAGGGLKVDGSGTALPVSGSVGVAQQSTLFNSHATGAANTAVTATIAASAGTRAHVYSVAARCAGGSSSITITDGGTTIYDTPSASITTVQTMITWPVPLTGTTNSAVVVTLGACGSGNTGTLMVQADRY